MMSLDASGTLGDAIVFSKWKGRPYVRERVIPSNPKSGAQVGRRAMFSFLSKQWDGLSDANKATWQDLADQLVSTPFSAYVSANMEDWHNFLAPSKVTPATRTATPSDHELTDADWEENRIKLVLNGTSHNQLWLLTIFAKDGGAVTPAVGNAILCLPDTVTLPATFFWTPPSVATWHFTSICSSIDGKKAGAGPPQQAAP